MVTKNRRNNGEKQPQKTESDSSNSIKPKAKIKESVPKFKVTLVCAIFCGIINMYHVSSMFENDRHFSHLSNLEREMTFRTEMGLYYSYYKTLIESDSFVLGLNKLMYDNRTEYPNTINTLERFNLYPEFVLGGSYRLFASILDYFEMELPRTCWEVNRGEEMDAVISCEGLGDPVYWYLSGVWLSAGATAALIFLHGSQLSYSLSGGFIAVMCFFFNHGEATRVQWTPPLRESFAFPWSVALNIVITQILRSPDSSFLQPLIYGTLALNYLLCWQFSQFTVSIHMMLVYVLYVIEVIPPLPMLLVIFGGFYAFTNNIVLQFGNSLVLASPLSGCLFGLLLLYVFIEPVLYNFPYPTNIGMQLAAVVISTIGTKIEISHFLGVEDDSHILNILRSKFSNYTDFHTLLYTCSPEFEFLPKESLQKLFETMLLPSVILVLGCFIGHMFVTLKRNLKKKHETKIGTWHDIDVGVMFNFMLLFVYGVMAMLIMRLKLFFTPQLCCMASLLASTKYWRPIVKREVHVGLLVALIGTMVFRGVSNIREQRSVYGEYSNVHLEELINWIEVETGQNAVFAGPMPTMANILLSTRRPIVNHPHYENALIRDRTKLVYSIFSRRTPEQVYSALVSLKVNYVVLDESWCLRKHKPGCGMVDIWDVEEPENKKRPPLCPKLFHRSPSPFQKVFSNSQYVVLQVPSKYVEIPAPRTLSV